MKLQRMNMAIISSAMQGRQACTVLLVTSDISTCTDASGATFLAWAMAVPSKSEVEFLDGSFQDDWGWQCSWRVRGLSILSSWVANAEIISAMVILRLVSSLLKKFMDVWHAMLCWMSNVLHDTSEGWILSLDASLQESARNLSRGDGYDITDKWK